VAVKGSWVTEGEEKLGLLETAWVVSWDLHLNKYYSDDQIRKN